MDDAKRREELYRGSVFVYSPSPSAMKLCEFARELIEKDFHPHDPREDSGQMPVERCVEILADLKPKFIHHPGIQRTDSGLLAERGCDLEKTYFDVPRLRTAFPSDYLASGIAYAFHPHRDTWYSAPFSQLNWWMPVYEICPKTAWRFIRGIGVKRSPTAPLLTITTNGTGTPARVPCNILRPTPENSLVLRCRWDPTRTCRWCRGRRSHAFFGGSTTLNRS